MSTLSIIFLAWAAIAWFSGPFDNNFLDLFFFGIDPFIPFVLAILSALTALALLLLTKGNELWRKTTVWLKVNRKTLAVLLFILLGHFLLQLPAITNYRGSNVADTGLQGIAGYHIAEGKTRPMFAYGKHNIGTLIPHITAPFNLLLGKSAFYLRLVNSIFYLGFLVIFFALVKKLFDNKTALAAAALAAIPPYAIFDFLRYTEYVEILFWGTLSLCLLVRLLDSEQWNGRLFFWYGITFGVGYWAHPQMFYFITVGFAALFLRDKLFFARPAFLAAPFGFLAGGIVNVVDAYYHEAGPFDIFGQGSDLLGIIARVPEGIMMFFLHWPKYLGAQTKKGEDLFGFWVTWPIILLFVLCLAVYIYVCRRQTREALRLRSVNIGPALFLLFIPIIILIFSAHESAREDSAFNYMWPFWMIVPVTVSVAAVTCSKWKRIACPVVFSVFAGIFLVSMAIAHPVIFERELRHQVWESFCRDRGIKYFYGPWVRTYLNNYVTQEEIIGSSIFPKYQFEPYLPYQSIVDDASERPAYLFVPTYRHRQAAFERILQNLGIRYESSHCPLGRIIYGMSERVTPKQIVNLSRLPYEADFLGWDVHPVVAGDGKVCSLMLHLDVRNSGRTAWSSSGRKGFIELLAYSAGGRELRRQPLSLHVAPGETIRWRMLLSGREGPDPIVVQVRVNDIVISKGKKPLFIHLHRVESAEPISARELDATTESALRRLAEVEDYIFFSGWGATRRWSEHNVVRWSGARESVIGFFLEDRKPLRIAMRITPFRGSGIPIGPQCISFACNKGEPFTAVALEEARRVRIEIPQDSLKRGVNILTLRYLHTEPEFWPEKERAGFSYRPRAAAVSKLSFMSLTK